jgi:hypothetical protein
MERWEKRIFVLAMVLLFEWHLTVAFGQESRSG